MEAIDWSNRQERAVGRLAIVAKALAWVGGVRNDSEATITELRPALDEEI